MVKIVNELYKEELNSVECGQFYVRKDDPESLWIVAKTDGKFCLIGLKNGFSYTNLTPNIGNVFGNFRQLFQLVENITITIH